MPRPTLPVHFKNFETYPVRLTQTTEEELKKHYEEMCSNYEPYSREVMSRLQDALSDLRSENPYIHCNWRKRTPERKYEKGHEWDDLTEDKVDIMNRFNSMRRELKACVSFFKWEDDWVNAYLYYEEQHRTTLKDTQQQLVRLDEQHWKNAKTQWETEDAEWIADRKLYKDHTSFHKPKSYYEEQMKKDPAARDWYERQGGVPNYEETCKYCIHDKQERDKIEERVRKEMEEAERYEEERKERERKQQEEEEKNRKPVEYKDHHCEVCDYHTVHGAVFRVHMTSKDHERKAKFKSWYCEKCEQQCRNQNEYDYHITTRKHKKACGELEEQGDFHCECCNYTTPIKQNYHIHLKSKKHQENMKSQSVEVPTTDA